MRLKKNEQELLAEAYEAVMQNQKLKESTHKCECGCDKCGPGCECDKDCECKKKDVREAKDQDGDGDNDFDDVKIARMVASGMSKEEAIAKVKKTSNKTSEEKE